MPPALAAFLWFGWPRVRRVRLRTYGLYFAGITTVIAAAELVAAYFVGGRAIPIEVLWAMYFLIAWRLAWEVWKRTVGRIGEPLRRWGRLTRSVSSRKGRGIEPRRMRLARIAACVPVLRVLLTLLFFAPLLCGALIHRIKIGNPANPWELEAMKIQTVSFQTADGLTLSGWFLPERGSDSTVVICHGAGANKGNFIGFLTLFYTQGCNALIFDFRGHGESDGHTSTFGLFESRDVIAAVDWLKRERPGRAVHVFGLGSSMGAMALARAAAEDTRIEAVVLDSCFVSARRFVSDHLRGLPLAGGLITDLALAGVSLHAGRSFWQLDATEAVRRISPRPILLIHGADDQMIAPAQMDDLFAIAGQPKSKWLGPGPHSNVLAVDFENYQKRVVEFFNAARAASSAAGR